MRLEEPPGPALRREVTPEAQRRCFFGPRAGQGPEAGRTAARAGPGARGGQGGRRTPPPGTAPPAHTTEKRCTPNAHIRTQCPPRNAPLHAPPRCLVHPIPSGEHSPLPAPSPLHGSPPLRGGGVPGGARPSAPHDGATAAGLLRGASAPCGPHSRGGGGGGSRRAHVAGAGPRRRGEGGGWGGKDGPPPPPG